MQTKFRYFAHGLVPCVPPRAIGKIIEYDDKPDTHWMLGRNAKWRKLSARRFHRLMTSDQFKPTEAK